MAEFEDHLPYHAWGSRYLELRHPELRGTDVKVFQTLFNQFLQRSAPPDGPLGTAIVEDGYFGPITSRAVREWQSYFGLSSDGVIGPVTGATLGQYNPAYGGPRFGSRAIDAVGQRGGDVWVLQNRLDCYRYGSYFGSADGDFGTGLSNAIQQFQGDMTTMGNDPGVPVSGGVEYETFDALWAYTYVGGRNLDEQRNGIDTLWLQHFLTRQGLYTGPLDGYFGPGTANGVKKFQASQAIAIDGVVGPVTMKRIGTVFHEPAGMWP